MRKLTERGQCAIIGVALLLFGLLYLWKHDWLRHEVLRIQGCRAGRVVPTILLLVLGVGFVLRAALSAFWRKK